MKIRNALATVNKKDLLFGALCAALLAVHLANLWRMDLLPFTDLPNHLAEAYLLRRLPDPAEPLRAYYSLQVSPTTPATLHAYFCSLFPDVEIGNKVFYSLYLLLLPFSLMLLVRMARGDRWIALLSILLLYNFSTTWGFSAFTLGIALTLVEMAILAGYLDKPCLPQALALTLTGLALFYAHAIIFVFAAAVVTVTVLSRKGLSTGSRLLGIATQLPAGMLTAAWLIPFLAGGNEQSILSFLISYYRNEYFPTWLHRLTGLLNDNKQLAPTPTGQIISLLLLAPVLLGFAIFGSRNRFRHLLPGENGARHVALVFLVLAGTGYLILPDQLPGWWYLYQRFSALLLLGVIWITSWLVPTGSLKPARAVAVLVVVVHAALWFRYFGEFKETAKPFRTLLYHSTLAQDHTLAALIDAPDFRGRPVFIHFQNYQLIWNHGAVPSVITEYRFRLVGQKAGVLPLYQEWLTNQDYGMLLDRYDGVDLLIAHGSEPLAYVAQDGRYSLANLRGDWALLEVRSGK